MVNMMKNESSDLLRIHWVPESTSTNVRIVETPSLDSLAARNGVGWVIVILLKIDESVQRGTYDEK